MLQPGQLGEVASYDLDYNRPHESLPLQVLAFTGAAIAASASDYGHGAPPHSPLGLTLATIMADVIEREQPPTGPDDPNFGGPNAIQPIGREKLASSLVDYSGVFLVVRSTVHNNDRALAYAHVDALEPDSNTVVYVNELEAASSKVIKTDRIRAVTGILNLLISNMPDHGLVAVHTRRRMPETRSKVFFNRLAMLNAYESRPWGTPGSLMVGRVAAMRPMLEAYNFSPL